MIALGDIKRNDIEMATAYYKQEEAKPGGISADDSETLFMLQDDPNVLEDALEALAGGPVAS